MSGQTSVEITFAPRPIAETIVNGGPNVDVSSRPGRPKTEIHQGDVKGDKGDPGEPGIQGPPGEVTSDDLQAHVDSPLPHPVYDDGPSLEILYENAKV